MRRTLGTLFFLLCSACLFCFPSKGLAERSQKDPANAGKDSQPMVIKSDSLVVNDTKKVVAFSGRVNAKRDEFTIECDKLLVYYERSGSDESGNAMGSSITKIVADGNVRVRRQAGGEAVAQHAEYYEASDKIVLTGDPMVKQGEDFVKGDKITIFLKDNRSIVESSGERRVKAVIYPKKEKK